MSAPWIQIALVYEVYASDSDTWASRTIGPVNDPGEYADQIRREFHRLKAREIVYPEELRNIKLLRQTWSATVEEIEPFG